MIDLHVFHVSNYPSFSSFALSCIVLLWSYIGTCVLYMRSWSTLVRSADLNFLHKMSLMSTLGCSTMVARVRRQQMSSLQRREP
jgi:hypothetical protein